MNERLQITALYRAFLARFFENEISENSRDMKSSFLWIIGILAAPGLLIPMSNLWRWTELMNRGPEIFRREIISDKVAYLSFAMGGVMLLAAVVWQALLVDRRDAMVLGSFPVRARVIVAGKLAALFAYLGIVSAGMHVIAALGYGTLLSTNFAEFLLGILGLFASGTLACVFACLAVAAVQAAILAIAGPAVFARVTAPAQLLLAASGLALFLMFPMTGGAAVDFVRGHDRSAWVLWMPPVWFVGIWEVMAGVPQRAMPEMAVRALAAIGTALAALVALYPLAYRRTARAAMQGSPLGKRESVSSRIVARLMRALPVRADVRGAMHFILLTTGRVARNKLIGATALGAALAMSLPFILRWAAQDWVPGVPARSHIAVPFVFVMFGLAGLRMAYNVPSEFPASWIFTTAVRPARIGTSAARLTGLLLGAFVPAAVVFAAYLWYWNALIAITGALTMLAFGGLISEIGIRSVDFVPYTRSYNPERGRLQARWPIFLIAMVLFLQFLPWASRMTMLSGTYWIVPAFLAAIAFGLRVAHPPEPPPLVDADLENKPLALRLY